MLNLFRAEWSKIVGNRWVTGCMIWVFPIATAAFFAMMALVVSLSDTTRQQMAAETHNWTQDMIGVWGFPNNPLGRLLLIAFTAVIFGGEYQWSTWKNLVPRNQRPALILVKFLALGALIVLAFGLTSLVAALGMRIVTWIAHTPYGPPLTAAVLRDFAGDYALQAGLAFTSTVIAAAYSALAAMLTRSILGGVIVGLGAFFVENLSAGLLAILAFFLHFPDILQLYRFTPAYNLLNVAEWITNGKTFRMELPYSDSGRVILSDSAAFSVAMLALWVVGLMALIIFLFRRQDITS